MCQLAQRRGWRILVVQPQIRVVLHTLVGMLFSYVHGGRGGQQVPAKLAPWRTFISGWQWMLGTMYGTVDGTAYGSTCKNATAWLSPPWTTEHMGITSRQDRIRRIALLMFAVWRLWKYGS